MKKVFLNEFSAFELKNMIQDEEIDSAITVFGSCESHGWHLPLGPDLFVPTEIARQAALRLSKTVVVPGVPFGTSLHYNHYPLSVTLRFETTIALAEDIFTSLIEHGIRRIVILNGHDGNIPALEIAARKVKDRFKDAVLVFVPAWWNITGARLADMFDVWNGLGHGGEGETSITMAVRPELVDVSLAERQVPEDVMALGSSPLSSGTSRRSRGRGRRATRRRRRWRRGSGCSGASPILSSIWFRIWRDEIGTMTTGKGERDLF
ncbi:creatininase family protein [Aminiphilus circumscriptus]|uniref:creatininase family protein n=1 Tax=Aminiphilus circumscriptus TaxID=290732 RepID=UPI0004B6A9D8|nr:creatininase family protein [Aminiphilus circumscriptus]